MEGKKSLSHSATRKMLPSERPVYIIFLALYSSFVVSECDIFIHTNIK